VVGSDKGVVQKVTEWSFVDSNVMHLLWDAYAV